MLIWLDAGHGGNDPGTVAGGVMEKALTLDIDNRINKLLKAKEISTKRTRTNDKTVDPNPRSAKIKASGAKYCISSHINAGGGTGAETIFSSFSNRGRILAQEILNELGKLGLTKRRAFSRRSGNGKDYYFMHRQTGSVTTVICEYAFLDNAKDRQFVNNPNNRQKIAQAVVNAIFKVEGIKDTPKSTKPSKSKSLLVVDGYWGRLTTLALQKHFGTIQDGVISKPSLVIRKLQSKVGARVDGYLGKETIQKLQRYLGTIQDGKLSKPSLVVKALQRRLNQGKL